MRRENLEHIGRRPGGEVRQKWRGRRGRRGGIGESFPRQYADLAEGVTRATLEQPAVDLAPERRPSPRLVAVHVVHERAGVEAVLVPDAQAFAQQRARARCPGQRAKTPGARGEGGKISLKVGE